MPNDESQINHIAEESPAMDVEEAQINDVAMISVVPAITPTPMKRKKINSNDILVTTPERPSTPTVVPGKRSHMKYNII